MEAARKRQGTSGNSRRQVIAGLAAAPAAALSAQQARAPVQAGTIEAGVVVVGGGTAGAIAAIQAARLGVQTVLVEAGSQLGGTLSTAGVDFPGLFHAWGKQVIRGIGWSLVDAAVKLNSGSLPDFSVPYGERHWTHQVRLNGALYAALAEEACVKAGVHLRYYETPVSATAGAGGWRLRLAGKGTQVELKCRQLIDCTGNASVIAMAGLPRRREQENQPGTLIYRIAGYDMDKIDVDGIAAQAAAEVEAGRPEGSDFRNNLRGYLGNHAENATHVPEADSSTAELHTQTNIRGRASVLRMMRFLKRFPGFENLHLERLQPEAGVRETYRIIGRTAVSVGDYTSGRIFDDAVAYSFYPIDLHDREGVRPRQLKPGTVATIPLSALIPKDGVNLMVAGRSISSDRLANSALRVQASCMAMGQAAGAAAALAARAGSGIDGVPVDTVRKVLREHGAIVPV
jgi:hypothetical protein